MSQKSSRTQRDAASRRADHRAVMSKVDLKFDAGKLHFKLLGQMEFFLALKMALING